VRTDGRIDGYMRILAVTNLYPTSGAPSSGVFIEQQIKSLRQIGLEVDVFFIDRHRLGMRVYFFLASHLLLKISKFKPDLIHVMYGGIMAERITHHIKNIPVVVTFHGSDLLGEKLSGPVRQMIAGLGVRCSGRAAKRARGIIVVSRVLLAALPREIDQSKVKVIPCGIDLDRFKPLDKNICRARLGWDANRFHVLFSGSRDPVKRPGLARAAAENLCRCGINAEIHYLRDISNAEVGAWLNASDVALLTSLHEGSPTIIKEALACNLPVVSVDVGDVAERLQGIEGCYIALPEPGDIATKLSWVYSGRRRVEGRVSVRALSLECIARQLKETYEAILGWPADTTRSQELVQSS